MGRVPDVKRLNKEDFESEQQELIEKIAYPLNTFMEQTRELCSGNIDFSNLNQQVIELTLSINAQGEPTIDTAYKSTLKSRVIGHSCINATNLTNSLNTPTGQPFITFAQNGALVNIVKVTNLQVNERYKLVVISYGQSLS